MAAQRRQPIQDKDLKGLKYFKVLAPLLERLHHDATARDRAGNRLLFYDQYACLLLLFFSNAPPSVLHSCYIPFRFFFVVSFVVKQDHSVTKHSNDY